MSDICTLTLRLCGDSAGFNWPPGGDLQGLWTPTGTGGNNGSGTVASKGTA